MNTLDYILLISISGFALGVLYPLLNDIYKRIIKKKKLKGDKDDIL